MRNLSSLEVATVSGGIDGQIALSVSYNTLAYLGVATVGVIVGGAVVAAAGLGCFLKVMAQW